MNPILQNQHTQSNAAKLREAYKLIQEVDRDSGKGFGTRDEVGDGTGVYDIRARRHARNEKRFRVIQNQIHKALKEISHHSISIVNEVGRVEAASRKGGAA